MCLIMNLSRFLNFHCGHFENRRFWQFRPYTSRVNRLIRTREMSLNKMIPLMEGPGGGGVHGNPPWSHGLLP